MMSHEAKVAFNRAVIRSKIREIQSMIAHIEGRSDIGANMKTVATGGLYETVKELEADWDNGWVGLAG